MWMMAAKPVLDRDKYGPWAVIAGGSDGTGAAFARDIAASGINLLLVARRPGPLEMLAEELRQAHGVEVETLSLDLNRPEAAQRMAEVAEGKEVGLYISNAGAEKGGNYFLEQSSETIHDLIARNVVTVADACRLFGAPMVARGRGGMVLMGSGAGLGGQPGVATYSSVKAFVLNLAESLWGEWRASGVDVIGIAAPIMDTPTLRGLLGDMVIPGMVSADEVARTALERMQAGAPCHVYPLDPTPEEALRQSDIRRDRILAVQAITASLFGH
jgi:short-subunit dehydrogenase